MDKSKNSKVSQSSPFKGAQFQRLQQQKQYILKIIFRLFVIYAAKSSKYIYKQMTEKCFMDLISQAFALKKKQLIKNSQTWKMIANLYYLTGRKHGLEFDEFVALLPVVASYLSQEKSSEQQFKETIKYLMLVYSQKAAKQTQSRVVELNTNISKETFEFMKKLDSNLIVLYKLFFSHEITNKFSKVLKPEEQSFEALLLFLKDFEIYPKFITASTLYLLYYQILQNESFMQTHFEVSKQHKSKGKHLNYIKFKEMLVHIARLTLPKLRDIQDPEMEIIRQKQHVKTLFEYMQNIKYKNKTSKFKQLRFCLILYDEYQQIEQRSVHKNKIGTDRNTFYNMFEKMKF